MTIEQFQKAAALVDAMQDENERLDKIYHAHKVVNEFKVDKLLLLGIGPDGKTVAVEMVIPRDILLDAILRTIDQYTTNIDKLQEQIRQL